MDPIYVTGHRNPDTDSIVSAMAYAALRNALGDREYQAARLGHVSDETQLALWLPAAYADPYHVHPGAGFGVRNPACAQRGGYGEPGLECVPGDRQFAGDSCGQ